MNRFLALIPKVKSLTPTEDPSHDFDHIWRVTQNAKLIGEAEKANLEAAVKANIKKVGENQYEVDRKGVELIIKNYAKLAGTLRSKPTKEGMRVSGIKPDDILSELGLQTGDMLQSINGFDMSDPDKAVDAYAKLRKAGQLDIQMTRDGAPKTIGVKITK